MHEITARNNARSSHSPHRFSRRTFLRTAGLGLALGLPLAACQPVAAPAPSPVEPPAPAEGPEVTLIFWHQLSQGALDSLLEQFRDVEIGIQVDAVAIPSSEFRTKLLAAYAAGEAPNVAHVDAVPDGADFFVKGMLHDLDYIFDETGLDRDDFLAHVLDANRTSTMPYEGALTGIPLAVWPVAAIYNQDHLEEAGLSLPETLDEFVEVAKALTRDDSERWGFPLGDVGYPPSLVFAILGAQHHLAGFDHAEETAAQWVLDALGDHGISPPGQLDPVEMFRQGQGSILWGSTGALQYLEQAGTVNLVAAMVPGLQPDAFATSATLRSLSLTSMQEEEKLRAGAKLIKFLSENSAELLKAGGGLSPRQSQIEKQERNPDLWNPFIESMYAMNYDQFVTPIVTDSLFTNQLDRVWKGELNATDAITIWNEQFSENAETGRAPVHRDSAGTVHNISFNRSALLAQLMQRYSIQGCCFMNWLPWCC